MRLRPLVMALLATIISALPCALMAVIAYTQFGNLWLQPPYVREFPATLGFWLGFSASVAFFVVCVNRGLRRAASVYLLVPIAMGIGGGVAIEIMSRGDPKIVFPIGFFEIAPLSWVIAGIIDATWKRSGDRSARHAA